MNPSRLALVLAVLLLTGCSSLSERTSAELMIGSKVAEGGFYGSGPIATPRVRHSLTDRVTCEYMHISFITKGRPFGPSSEEGSLDALSCGIGIGRR